MNKHIRPSGEVRCIESGEVFASVADAAGALDLDYHRVWASATGKRKSPVQGCTFEYTHDQSYSIRGRRLE